MSVEKFTANLPTKKIVFEGYHSPRGLREGHKRVETFDIEIKKNYNRYELSLLVRYLNDLSMSMDLVKLN